MSLLAPLALFGLLTLPAILVLHLLRNRREQLPISSLRLWRGLQQKKHGEMPRSIPLSLMLILQLLVATALTLGLAQPVLSFLLDQPEHTIFLLDTTTSMLSRDTTVGEIPQFISESIPLDDLTSRFDVAREIIKSQLQLLDDGDSFVMINLNGQPDVLLSGDGSQKLEAQLTLDNLVPGGTGVDLPAALTLANGLIAADRPNKIVVLSDGNYSVNAARLPQIFAPLEWQTVGAGASAENRVALSNQALLNVSSRTLFDGRHRLFARVVNYSDDPVERTLQVTVDDQPFAELSIQLEAQAEATEVWTLPTEAETAAVEIVEADALLLDNRAELLIAGSSRYQVLLLSEQLRAGDPPNTDENIPLVRALEAQPGLSLTVGDPATPNDYDFDVFDLIVFEGLPATLTAWPAGNLLVLNPSLGHPLLTAQNFVRNLRPEPETASSLLAGIDLSGVYFNRLPQLTVPDWAEVDLRAVMVGNEGETQPLIFHGSIGASQIVVWTFDLSQSNLPARLALPLLTGNTVASLLTRSLPPVVPLGEPVLLGRDVNIEIPGGQRLSFATQAGLGQSQFDRTKQAGIYRVFEPSGTLAGGFATHAGSALESNLTVHFTPDSLTQIDIGAASAPEETDFYDYWPWLVAFALALIMVEGALAWRK